MNRQLLWLSYFSFISFINAKAEPGAKLQAEKAIQAVIASYFQPSFHESLKLSAQQISSLRDPYQLTSLTGWVQVTPPKSSCLIIRRALNQRDMRICQPRRVSFKGSDLDVDGRLRWTVILPGSTSSGIEVSWQTPYKLGHVVPFTMKWPGPSRRVLITACTVKNRKNRRISLAVAGYQQPWIITLPSADYMVQQPPQPPKLFVLRSGDKKGFAQSNKNRSKENLKSRQPKVSASEHRGYKEQTSKRTTKRAKESEYDEALRKRLKIFWKLKPRGTFTMNGSHLITRESGPPGMHGRCRYNYQEEILECHRSDNYHWVYLPLTCLGELRQTVSKNKK